MKYLNLHKLMSSSMNILNITYSLLMTSCHLFIFVHWCSIHSSGVNDHINAMNCILSHTAVRWLVHMHTDWLRKHLMLYMPSYAGGKVLYSAQFVRSVLLHSRDLYNIFHFPLTEGAHSHWLFNLNTVLQHGDALNLFIEKKKAAFCWICIFEGSWWGGGTFTISG